MLESMRFKLNDKNIQQMSDVVRKSEIECDILIHSILQALVNI